MSAETQVDAPKETHLRPTAPGVDESDIPQELFEEELKAIGRLRAAQERPLPPEPEKTAAGQPSVDRGLTGLAISGGGIRSATFALGVMQALARNKFLRQIDYLSTVSGGGYIGSALTWLLSGMASKPRSGVAFGLDKENFPFGADPPGSKRHEGKLEDGLEQKAMLRYLRQHGKYLVPGKGITATSSLAIFLRGLLLNLLVWPPIAICLLLGLLLLSEQRSGKSISSEEWPVLFIWLLWGAAIFFGIFLLLCIIYSLATFKGRGKSEGDSTMARIFQRYRLRRAFEKTVRVPLWLTALLLLVGSLPAVEMLVADWVASAGGVGGVLAGLASGFWTYAKTGKEKKKEDKGGGLPMGLIAPLGAGLLIYGLLVLSHKAAMQHFVSDWPWQLYLGALAVAVVTGLLVNLNYISLHRFYRDRLMETFMPNVELALEGGTGPADLADKAKMHQVWGGRSPYPIVNTNAVLVDSDDRTYRTRGGDNFILSPLFSGSKATGWRDTESFMAGGMTLASAMAISGAAANPNTGVGGVGVTRNELVSVLMSLLNLRLGYWAPNPERKRQKARVNHFQAAWYELFGRGYREDLWHLQISDGGHFENLALYELVRRRLKLIICTDAGADPSFTFSDLILCMRRIGADFGARIVFDDSNKPERLIPSQEVKYPTEVKVAERPFIHGNIVYRDGSKGDLIYIKSTLIEKLPLHVLGYKGDHDEFPHQTTADQFFDETQFEAYRELGYELADHMLEKVKLEDLARVEQEGAGGNSG